MSAHCANEHLSTGKTDVAHVDQCDEKNRRINPKRKYICTSNVVVRKDGVGYVVNELPSLALPGGRLRLPPRQDSSCLLSLPYV